jgi:D-sedoheptulose 7-phosphate isomerase
MTRRPLSLRSAPVAREHLADHVSAVMALALELERLDTWGRRLAEVLLGGGRLLTAGNGGSAAEAQHLAAELVGRYRRPGRPPLSAIALTMDTCSLTAISNDFGWNNGLARQVQAHGRPGDVLIALSTSGRSANVLAAVHAAREAGLTTWGLTGPAPNQLHRLCDEAVAVPGPGPVVQEVHLVAIHLLCEAVDAIAAGAAPKRPLSEAG